jgi:isopropylmalate/homocitrate/citramalate synthase
MMSEVKICDVTLRDGMQAVNRTATLPLGMRRDLAVRLQDAGLPYIEVGSFVNPKVIPAMRDTPELFATLRRRPGQELAALAPSLRYYEQLRETPNVDTVGLLVSASEEYAQVNTRMTGDKALAAAAEVAQAARGDGLRVRAYMSYAFREMSGEESSTGTVAEICDRLLSVGCEVIALSDTDGKASPAEVRRVVGFLDQATGLEPIAVHLHDRYGSGLVKALIAFQAGVRVFDSTVGGVGGNKLLENSVGNIATEELVNMFHGLGVETGVDVDELTAAGQILLDMVRFVGDPMPPSKILADQLATGVLT